MLGVRSRTQNLDTSVRGAVSGKDVVFFGMRRTGLDVFCGVTVCRVIVHGRLADWQTQDGGWWRSKCHVDDATIMKPHVRHEKLTAFGWGKGRATGVYAG